MAKPLLPNLPGGPAARAATGREDCRLPVRVCGWHLPQQFGLVTLPPDAGGASAVVLSEVGAVYLLYDFPGDDVFSGSLLPETAIELGRVLMAAGARALKLETAHTGN